MRHRSLWLSLAGLAILGVLAIGCGPGENEPLRTAPGTDTRSPQEKETDALLQKSHQDYNKKYGR
jgi:hypothetical protein